MKIHEIVRRKDQIYQIAAKHGIKQVYLFGSVARGESKETSDVDFLIEMEEGASAFGVGGFQYEVQRLLGVQIDVIPTYVFPKIEDRKFIQAIQTEAVAL